jgi:putative membrane protein
VTAAEAVSAVTPVPADDDPRWRRTHPASPWFTGLTMLGATTVFLLRELRAMVRQDVDLTTALDTGSWWFWVIVVVEAIIVLAMIVGVIGWRHRWFLVADDALHVRSGRLSRTHTTVPLDRVQSVDVVRPLIPRIFGFAKLSVEAAGDDGSAVTLELLRNDGAHRVRATLLRENPGARGPAAHEVAPQALVAAVPPERTKQAILRSPAPWGAAVVLLGALGVIAGGALLGESRMVLSAVAMVAGSGAALAKSVFGVLDRCAGFRVAADGGLLRVHHGIAEEHHRTIAPGRILAVTLSQPPWWRAPGWWEVSVTVPGLDDDEDDEKASPSTLFPVATTPEVLRLVALALPDARLAGTIGAALTGERLADAGFLTAPRRARVLAPLGWRFEGVLATATVLVVRRGRWIRTVTIVGHEHPQAVTLAQGPFARRRRLADVTFALPAKTLTVENLDLGAARNLFREQVRRAS